MVTFPNAQTGLMQTFPEHFYNDSGELTMLSQETLRLAWEIAMNILNAAQPQNPRDFSQFVIHVELLKYSNSYQELEDIFNLLNSGSAWKRLGIKLDLERSRARGPFKRRYIRDIYAWLAILPVCGDLFKTINNIFRQNSFDRLDNNFAPVGQAHIDGCRFLTILASDRDVMKTEAYANGKWEEMPMSKDHFVIFPGSFFDPTQKIQPTIHRYSIHKTRGPRTNLNLTLVLGISTKAMFENRKPKKRTSE